MVDRTYRGPSAGPLPSRPALAMCARLDAACIAVPSGDRLTVTSDEGWT